VGVWILECRGRTPIPHKAVRVRDGINTEPGRKQKYVHAILQVEPEPEEDVIPDGE